MATSKLQNYVAGKLNQSFGNLKIYENYRPDWMRGPELERLELDFYIPELGIAIEVQGNQHYEFVEFFHKTVDEFETRKERDKAKIGLCDGRGIILTLIHTELDADIFISNLKDRTKEPDQISISLDTSFCYNRIKIAYIEAERAIKKANKSKGFKKKANCKTATAIYRSLKYGVELNETIDSYYRNNKQEVDCFLRMKIEGKIIRDRNASQKIPPTDNEEQPPDWIGLSNHD